MLNDRRSNASPRLKLLVSVFIRLVIVIPVLGILIFFPAGSLAYWNGWLFLIALLTPMFFTLMYFLIKDPGLIEKRLHMKEKEKEQKLYVKLSITMLLLTYILPGLDYRFHWSHVPFGIVISATVIMEIGYIMFILVMKENRYASRVIEIQENQKVIDFGMYSIVRHPLYLAATILYGISPIVLGSFYALIPVAFLPFVLAYRIINEEKVLMEGLPGYKEYMTKVKFRLIPFIW